MDTIEEKIKVLERMMEILNDMIYDYRKALMWSKKDGD